MLVKVKVTGGLKGILLTIYIDLRLSFRRCTVVFLCQEYVYEYFLVGEREEHTTLRLGCKT